MTQLADFTPVYVASPHVGPPRLLLLALKEGRRAEVRQIAAAALSATVRAARGAGPVVLVPVPSRRGSRRRRGEDLVADLAARAAALERRAGRRTEVHRLLEMRRRVADQTDLDAAGRRRNLHGAMRLRGAAPPWPCLVLDDVVTTTATAAEAVRVLRGSGALVCGVVSLTASPITLSTPPDGFASTLAMGQAGTAGSDPAPLAPYPWARQLRQV